MYDPKAGPILSAALILAVCVLGGAAPAAAGPAVRAGVIRVEETLPAPDFSALEPYYEVVRYNYDRADGKLYLVLKARSASRPAFTIHFYDEDGVQIIDETFLVGASVFAPVGAVEKVMAYLPPKGMVPRVRKVVLVASLT